LTGRTHGQAGRRDRAQRSKAVSDTYTAYGHKTETLGLQNEVFVRPGDKHYRVDG